MALMVGLFVHNMLRPPQLSDDALREKGIVVLPKPRELQPFELKSSAGGTFGRDDLLGHWTFAYFGFTHCPDICPITLSVMAKARQKLVDAGVKDPFHGMLVSVDPERDTPQALADYVRYFSPSFIGLTGAHDDIAALASELSVAFAAVPAKDQPDGYVVDHTPNIVILNPRGHYYGYIRPPQDPEQLVLAFRSLSARM